MKNIYTSNKNSHKLFAGLIALVLVAGMTSPAFANGPINEHVFLWTDPESGGQIEVTERVYPECDDGHQGEYTFEWEVYNIDYAGNLNGLSGWQLQFNEPIDELHNQKSPAIGGPWMQNAFSGMFPPFGAEWDVMDSEGPGILPGQTGVFSFCTYPREDIVVNEPPEDSLGSGPNGWAHSWFDDVQVLLFNGGNSIPGPLLDRPIGGVSAPVSTTALVVAAAQANMGLWSLALVGMVAAGAAITYKIKSNKSKQ